MIIERVVVGPLEVNCWIVSAEPSGRVAVIDPGDDFDRIALALGTREVAAVVLTHGHFDHIGAVRELVESTRAPLYAAALDAQMLGSHAAEGNGGAQFGFFHTAPDPDRILADGAVIEIGTLRLTALATPGHTPGSIVLLAQDAEGGAAHLFSGDTLFAGSVGRTDFPRGDARSLAHSIASVLAPLPPDTVVHPGHGPDTTIGREARINPFWPRA